VFGVNGCIKLGRGAGFQTGCVADFLIGAAGLFERCKFPEPAADWEVGDTASSEACATRAGLMHPGLSFNGIDKA
jgi:hypothetical protein